MVSYPRFMILLMIVLFFALTVSITAEAAKETIKQAIKTSLRSQRMIKSDKGCEFPGQYCETCQDCEYYEANDILTCKCATISGSYGPQVILQPRFCMGLIQNDNGNLVCTECESSGDFCSTCVYCHYSIETSYLSCHCKGDDGTYNHPTSILPFTCIDHIDNRHGCLVCEK